MTQAEFIKSLSRRIKDRQLKAALRGLEPVFPDGPCHTPAEDLKNVLWNRLELGLGDIETCLETLDPTPKEKSWKQTKNL